MLFNVIIFSIPMSYPFGSRSFPGASKRMSFCVFKKDWVCLDTCRHTTLKWWVKQTVLALCQLQPATPVRQKPFTLAIRRYSTVANRCHNFSFQSNTPGDFVMHEKKQIPCITSMLTRDVHFPPKAWKQKTSEKVKHIIHTRSSNQNTRFNSPNTESHKSAITPA